MELPTELDLLQPRVTDTPVLYTAVGWVAGTYLGGKKKFELGTLVTQDGQTINAFLSWQARHQLKKLTRKFEEPPELSELVCRWKIYPRTGPLRFDLVNYPR